MKQRELGQSESTLSEVSLTKHEVWSHTCGTEKKINIKMEKNRVKFVHFPMSEISHEWDVSDMHVYLHLMFSALFWQWLWNRKRNRSPLALTCTPLKFLYILFNFFINNKLNFPSLLFLHLIIDKCIIRLRELIFSLISINIIVKARECEFECAKAYYILFIS